MADLKIKDSLAVENGALKPQVAWTSKVFFLKSGLAKQFGEGKVQLNIKMINNFLLICIFIITFYLVNYFITTVKKINNIILESPALRPGQGISQTLSGLKELSNYLLKIKDRNIFRMGPKQAGEDIAEAISSKAAEIAKNYRLVGISWSDNPDALIEDLKAAKTFFIQKGQMIGDLKIENILKDKVIVRYGEDLIDLR